MWWLFKKTDNIQIEQKINKRINRIESGLINSFKNIKEDIDHLFTKIEDQENKLNLTVSKIEHLESKLSDQSVKDEIKEPKKDNQKLIEINTIRSLKTTINTLTDTQLSLLKKLVALQKENKDNWVLMRSLTEEAYPNKNPLKIRSTISSYLSILDDLGLIQKRRKGRQILLKITDRLKEFIPPEIKIKPQIRRKKS